MRDISVDIDSHNRQFNRLFLIPLAKNIFHLFHLFNNSFSDFSFFHLLTLYTQFVIDNPLCRFPSTDPCKMVIARVPWWHMCPKYFSFWINIEWSSISMHFTIVLLFSLLISIPYSFDTDTSWLGLVESFLHDFFQEIC